MSAVLSLLLLALGSSPDAGGPPPAKGSLDKEVIRAVIRGHIDEVKSCYEAELGNAPDLFGRIMVTFTISAMGDVIASEMESSTTGNSRVEACTVATVRRWRFPKPTGGGIVIVSYPFVFTPEATIPVLAVLNSAATVDVTVLDPATMVHRSTNTQGIPSNGLIAVTDRGLLLVDTAWTDVLTEALLKWGYERFRRPWIGAVITHDHADRDGGLGALQRWQIPVAALDLTVAKLTHRGLHGVTTLFTAAWGQFRDPRGFEAFYPGPGHTSDNIVLRFPTVLFGGCLIKSMEAKDLGFTGDANLASWPEAVLRVAARYPGVSIVPGHGTIDTTSGAFQHTLDLLAAARRK
jgi:metallo-beta-lactamase class B